MKRCKLCKIDKPTESFYIHPLMTDGHLSFCKECKKKYARNRSRSVVGREYDRFRNTTPARKLWLKKYAPKRRAKHYQKYRARMYFGDAMRDGRGPEKKPCEKCGDTNVHGHHPDYSKPLEVIWLCPKHHREIHEQYQRKYE